MPSLALQKKRKKEKNARAQLYDLLMSSSPANETVPS
jgi:hypothetical protein